MPDAEYILRVLGSLSCLTRRAASCTCFIQRDTAAFIEALTHDDAEARWVQLVCAKLPGFNPAALATTPDEDKTPSDVVHCSFITLGSLT
ncbi:unnamed protein product [Parajaminaea phylloscopi]